MISFFNKLSLRNKLLLVLIPGGSLYLAFLSYLFFDTTTNLIDKSILDEERKNIVFLSKAIDDFETKALTIAKIFAENPYVAEAYKYEDKELGSNYLMQKISPLIEKIKKDENIKDFQIHYHTPPAVSFLRTWTGKRFDDLSSFRPTILEVYQTSKPLKAIEFGVGGFALRGLAPIIIDGKYIGSCEFLYNISDIIELMSDESGNNDMFNIVLAATAEAALKKDQIEKFYSIKIDDYYISKANNEWANPEKILSKEILETMKSTDEAIANSHENIYFSLIPLKDYNGKKIGYTAFLKNNIENVASQMKQIYIKMVIIGLLIVGFILFVILFIEFRVIKPIRTATDIALKIAAGNTKIDE